MNTEENISPTAQIANSYNFKFDFGDGVPLSGSSMSLVWEEGKGADFTICRGVRLDKKGNWDFLFKDRQKVDEIHVFTFQDHPTIILMDCRLVHYSPLVNAGDSSAKLVERAVYRTYENIHFI